MIQHRPKSWASGYYHRRLAEVYRFLLPSGSSVIELGCGTGDLLASVRPKRGLGVDFAEQAILAARTKHPDLEFRHLDVHELEIEEKFDVVILSDLINDVWDVETVLGKVRGLCKPETRIILNSYNRLWQLPIAIARLTGIVEPILKQNWLSQQDVRNLLHISQFEVISTSAEILWPIRTPFIDTLFNKILVKLWPFNHLALTNFVVARMDNGRQQRLLAVDASVSVIVPARNEAGHIHDILARTPRMGSRTELIFVEGNSTDDTYEVLREAIEKAADPNIHLYQQPGIGKGDAVRFGYEHATGDILMILDADMTVAPEDLPRFYRANRSGARRVHQRSASRLPNG